MSFDIAPIVEGYGDVSALRVLLRMLAPSLVIKRPVRFPRTRLVQTEHLQRAVRIAASNIVERGAILLVIDADEDCAKDLASTLQSNMTNICTWMCRVVIAVREFEAWIVGGIPELATEHPDEAGDLKGRLREHFGVYAETADQPRLISLVDTELLSRRSRSFRRLMKVINEFGAADRGFI